MRRARDSTPTAAERKAKPPARVRHKKHKMHRVKDGLGLMDYRNGYRREAIGVPGASSTRRRRLWGVLLGAANREGGKRQSIRGGYFARPGGWGGKGDSGLRASDAREGEGDPGFVRSAEAGRAATAA